MKRTKIQSKFPGVRYREDPDRKYSGHPERYFSIRYQTAKKQTKEEGVGWETEGFSDASVSALLGKIRNAIKTGVGPQSLAEMRELAAKEKTEKEEAARIEAYQHMTLEIFWKEYFIPRIKKEKRSWRTDEQRIEKMKKIKPDLAGIPLQSVTHDHIQSIIDIMIDDGYEPATIKQYFGILRRTFYIAKETTVEGKIIFTGNNPAAKTSRIRLPAVNNERERFLTVDEADLLIEKSKEFRSIDLHDAIVLSLNTGLRLGELTRLEWSCVDLVHGFVTVKKEERRKTGGTVPLNKDAIEIFKSRIQSKGQSYLVFPPIYGENTRMNLTHDFQILAKRTEINSKLKEHDTKHKVVFHSLRHTFASWLALNGTDIYRIKELMRHSDIKMTMRYAHLRPESSRGAVENLRPIMNNITTPA